MIVQADATRIPLADGSVNCCVTSPPYWGLRDYGVAGQLGLEPTPELYVEKMVAVFREVRRVLKDDGTLWLNLGDSYAATTKQTGRNDNGQRVAAPASWNCRYEYERTKIRMGGGLKPKDLVGIPWRVAFALQADGWYLRQDIIWHKPNPMPESVTDRCTKAHEYIFLLSKSERYYFDAEAIREPNSINSAKWGKMVPTKTAAAQGKHGSTSALIAKMNHADCVEKYYTNGRNKRSVWTVTTSPYPEAHFATFPPKLIEPCIKAGCPEGGIVLDPFGGSGTTAEVALKFGRRCVLLELNPEYIKLATRRMNKTLDGQALFAKTA